VLVADGVGVGVGPGFLDPAVGVDVGSGEDGGEDDGVEDDEEDTAPGEGFSPEVAFWNICTAANTAQVPQRLPAAPISIVG
jgi:hypothetical protein